MVADMEPSISGFWVFVRQIMGIKADVLPDDAYVVTFAFNLATMIVNPDLRLVTASFPPATTNNFPSLYALCVYNLAGDRIINLAIDTNGNDFFANLRKTFKINDFSAGVVSSTNDEGTGVSLEVLDVFKNLTIAQLEYLSTPWGRAYLGYAQSAGPTLWGIS